MQEISMILIKIGKIRKKYVFLLFKCINYESITYIRIGTPVQENVQQSKPMINGALCHVYFAIRYVTADKTREKNVF